MLENFYRKIGDALPSWIIKKLDQMLGFAGIDKDTRIWSGHIITWTLLLFTFGAILILLGNQYHIEIITKNKHWIAIFSFLSLIGIPLLYLAYLRFLIAARAERAEQKFSDFLFAVSYNLKSGMTPLDAFLYSAKPQYGILGLEAKKAYEKALISGDVLDAFTYLSKRLATPMIRQFILFYRRAIYSGAKMAELLENQAKYYDEILKSKTELRTKTASMSMFIATINIIIVPFLMAIVYAYLRSYERILSSISKTALSGAGEMMFLSIQLEVSADFFLTLSTIFLFFSTIITAYLMGLMRRGKGSYGFKYFVLMFPVAVALLYISIQILSKILRLGM